MLIRYFMTTDVFTLPPDQTCEEAYRELRRRGIRRAPVMEDGVMVGLVSERDFLEALPGTIGQLLTELGEAALDTPVRSIMSREVRVLGPNDDLDTAARIMREDKIGGLPVVDKGELKGIITESDIFRAIWDILSFAQGNRLLIRERVTDPDRMTDYAAFCADRDFRVQTLLHHHLPDGTATTYLAVHGEGLDELISAIQKLGNQVISATELF